MLREVHAHVLKNGVRTVPDLLTEVQCGRLLTEVQCGSLLTEVQCGSLLTEVQCGSLSLQNHMLAHQLGEGSLKQEDEPG